MNNEEEEIDIMLRLLVLAVGNLVSKKGHTVAYIGCGNKYEVFGSGRFCTSPQGLTTH